MNHILNFQAIRNPPDQSDPWPEMSPIPSKVVVRAQYAKTLVPGRQCFGVFEPPFEKRILVRPTALDDQAIGSFDPLPKSTVIF